MIFVSLSGKRACAGESLARMEIFLFSVGLIQRFKFKMADNRPSLIGSLGITLVPKPFDIIAESLVWLICLLAIRTILRLVNNANDGSYLHLQNENNQAGTRRNNNVFTKSTRRRRRRVDVVKTLSVRHYCVMCPLGTLKFGITLCPCLYSQ